MAHLFDDILFNLPTEIRINVSSIAIYGNDASNLLVTCKDGHIYNVVGFKKQATIDSTANFLSSSQSSLLPASNVMTVKEVEKLAGEQIEQVVSNGQYTLIRTRCGVMFDNCNAEQNVSPRSGKRRSFSSHAVTAITNQTCRALFERFANLQDKKIAQVSCGVTHAACLTTFGEIYAWNTSTLEAPSRCETPTTNHTNEIVVVTSGIPHSSTNLSLTGCIASKKSPFVQITSYLDVVVGLNCDGQIYEWHLTELTDLPNYRIGNAVHLSGDDGFNSSRYLNGDSIRDVFITQISGGRAHCLAVSCTFAVYSWGCNDCGQLGLGQPTSISMSNTIVPQLSPSGVHLRAAQPTRISFFDEQPSGPLKKIKTVSSHYMLDLSIAEAVTGDIYVWGDLAVGAFSTFTSRPTLTKCRSIAEAIRTYGRQSYTTTDKLFDVPGPSLSTCLLTAFDNPQVADVHIVVPGGKAIYAHHTFLSIRSPRFLEAFACHGWQQGKNLMVAIEKMPYHVVRAFMYFLYTNEFKTETLLDVEDLVNLAEMAKSCNENLLFQQV